MADPDEIALAEARGRREAFEYIRVALTRELRGAPYNASPQAQLTYIGGLARARRMAERLYRQACEAEETLVLADSESAQPAAQVVGETTPQAGQ